MNTAYAKDMRCWRCSKKRRRITSKKVLEQILSLQQGIIVVEGPSGCGKTKFLKQITAQINTKVISAEELMDTAIFFIRWPIVPLERFFGNGNYSVVAFDDIDLLKGRIETQRYIGKQINTLAVSRLVIICGIDLSHKVPDLLCELNIAQKYVHQRSLIKWGRNGNGHHMGCGSHSGRYGKPR